MTVAINNIVRGGSQSKSMFESALPLLDSTVSYNQGDILVYDTVNNVLKAATGTDGAHVLGVAVNTVVSGLPKQVYTGTAVDSSTGESDLAGPQYSVVCSLYLTSGDAFVPGSAVYIGADAQTVTITDPGSSDSIGVFVGPAVTPAASGTKGDVRVGCRYGLSDIQF